jgi:hypothetical protein
MGGRRQLWFSAAPGLRPEPNSRLHQRPRGSGRRGGKRPPGREAPKAKAAGAAVRKPPRQFTAELAGQEFARGARREKTSGRRLAPTRRKPRAGLNVSGQNSRRQTRSQLEKMKFEIEPASSARARKARSAGQRPRLTRAAQGKARAGEKKGGAGPL